MSPDPGVFRPCAGYRLGGDGGEWIRPAEVWGCHEPSCTHLVGVDGSPNSIAALRWAADEAHRHGVELTAVTAWAVVPVGWSGYELRLALTALAIAIGVLRDRRAHGVTVRRCRAAAVGGTEGVVAPPETVRNRREASTRLACAANHEPTLEALETPRQMCPLPSACSGTWHGRPRPGPHRH